MAMATAGEYAAMVAGLRFIRRTARRLARLPDRQLRVSDEDAADAEYVNECLGIVLRMAGVKMEGSIPSCWEDFDAEQHYRQCMGLASRQAGRLLLGLRLGRIRKNMVTHNAWCNVDSAETHLRDLASCGVKRKGWRGWFFRKRR